MDLRRLWSGTRSKGLSHARIYLEDAPEPRAGWIHFRVPGSQVERRTFHYFVQRAAPELSGFIPSDYWCRFVPRICQDVLCVRKAVVALGLMYEEFTLTSGNAHFVPSEAAAQGHCKAMKSLRRYINSDREVPDAIAALTCCAIFCCIDHLLGDQNGALGHLSSGVAMLKHAQATKSSVDREGFRELTTIYARLDLQASVYDDSRPPTLMHGVQDRVLTDPCRTNNNGFASLGEASDALTWLSLNAFEILILHAKDETQ